MYSVYQLLPQERERLLKQFPPRYAKPYADHITVCFGKGGNQLPPPADKLEIIGRADDNYGLEVLVVRVNGNLTRPDGQIFHITWSLDPNKTPPADLDPIGQGKYKPVQSNNLICGLIDASGNLLSDAPFERDFYRYTQPVPFSARPEIKYTSAELNTKRHHTL